MATILYIEDEIDLRHDIAEELTREGHEVLMARNGCDGLDMALKHKPDLVISDINMPHMNGWELLEKLNEMRAESGAPPFMFLTAFFDKEHKAESLKLGAIDYLTKPIELDELIRKVEEHLPQNGGSTREKEMQIA